MVAWPHEIEQLALVQMMRHINWHIQPATV
jgi:hypothetical protein